MEITGQFQQLLQVNNLVITPVANIAPRIVGFFYFPINTFLGDPVRVVAVHRGCINKLRDDIFDKFRIAESQRLPVLEDIPPVAFIGEQAITSIVVQFDLELIPGATRVAMAAAESDWQVLMAEAFELRVAVVFDSRQQLGECQLIR